MCGLYGGEDAVERVLDAGGVACGEQVQLEATDLGEQDGGKARSLVGGTAGADCKVGDNPEPIGHDAVEEVLVAVGVH